jgi:hypothetical protein
VSEIDLDLRHLGHIAEHAGLEGEADLHALGLLISRKLQGEPAPAVLGKLGKILSYLHFLDAGCRPLRVVSGRPDFLVEEDGLIGCAAVEVAPPDHVADLSGERSWDILPQPGTLPFPADFALAHIHLINDPVSANDADVVSLHVRGARAPLPGWESRESWHLDYQAWSKALWARDPQRTLQLGGRLGAAASLVEASPPAIETVTHVGQDLFAERRPRSVWLAGGSLGVSVYADEERVELRSSLEEPSLTIDEARAMALKLVRVALDAFHRFVVDDVLLFGDLEPVVVRCQGNGHVLGWRAGQGPVPSLVAVKRRGEQTLRFGTPWMMALSVGDPRTALGVHSDGRGYLRFPRGLATDNAWTLSD